MFSVGLAVTPSQGGFSVITQEPVSRDRAASLCPLRTGRATQGARALVTAAQLP